MSHPSRTESIHIHRYMNIHTYTILILCSVYTHITEVSVVLIIGSILLITHSLLRILGDRSLNNLSPNTQVFLLKQTLASCTKITFLKLVYMISNGREKLRGIIVRKGPRKKSPCLVGIFRAFWYLRCWILTQNNATAKRCQAPSEVHRIIPQPHDSFT